MDLFAQIEKDNPQKTMRVGCFDNLPGKGKPLMLKEDPYQPSDWRMANSILHNQGFVYPWMDKPIQIEGDLEALHAPLRKDKASEKAVIQRRRILLVYLEQIKRFNRVIIDYNLCLPSLEFHCPIFNMASEIREAVRNITSLELTDFLDKT